MIGIVLVNASAATTASPPPPQNITVTGVPNTSRFAQVMVAADYRMKRLAMHFDKAPVRGLPSFLDLMPASSRRLELPRWWLAPMGVLA